MPKQDADGFLSAVADTPELWRSVNVRVVAIWARDAWQNVVASAHLDHREPEKIPLVPDLPRLDRLVALQEVFPVERLPTLIQRLRVRGTMNVSGTEVRFRSGGYENPFSRPYSSYYLRRGLSLSGYTRQRFDHGHTLIAYGESGSAIFREFPGGKDGIDVTLRRAGWQSLNELVLRGMGEVTAAPSETSSLLISFYAPIEVSLLSDQCCFRNGELTYVVSAGSKEAAGRAMITVTGENSAGKRIVRNIELATKRWTKRSGILRHSGRLRVAKTETVHLTLHAVGYELGRLTLVDEGTQYVSPPLLMLAHDALFAGERDFREVLLAPKSSEGRPFERAVAKLFAYCGFPTDQPGKVPQEQNGPDVLVAVPSRNLLLVMETTVKHLMNDDGKMNRLTKRTADVRFAVKHLNVDVTPIMVVPWPRETLVPVELHEAGQNGVRVLCNEDLAELLSMALARKPLSAIANYIVPEPPRPGRGLSALLRERNPLAD